MEFPEGLGVQTKKLPVGGGGGVWIFSGTTHFKIQFIELHGTSCRKKYRLCLQNIEPTIKCEGGGNLREKGMGHVWEAGKHRDGGEIPKMGTG